VEPEAGTAERGGRDPRRVGVGLLAAAGGMGLGFRRRHAGRGEVPEDRVFEQRVLRIVEAAGRVRRRRGVDGAVRFFGRDRGALAEQALAEELGLVTMVHAPIWKAELGQIADRHPALKIIIDHMGIMARCVDDAIGYWVSETADLHTHPNIYVKVSALPGYSTHPFPNLNIAKYVREMVDKMGPERCFWGTDLTRLLEHGLTYTDTIEQFTKHFPFTGDELEWIMGRGISECLGWPIPVQAG